MKFGSGRVRVLIATTEGPVDIQALHRESANLGNSLAVAADSLKTIDVSDDYAAFVAKETGVVEPLFGHRSYRLDLSSRIDIGGSWQLGCLIAHALLAADRLATKNQRADLVVWATGTIAKPGLDIGPVGFVADKLRLSLDRLRIERAAGSDVLVIIPEGNGQDLDAALTSELAQADISVLTATSMSPVTQRLRLPHLAPDFARGDRWRNLPAAVRAAIAASVALGIGLGGLFGVNQWRTPHVRADMMPVPLALKKFKSCETCPEMVELPTGKVTLGTAESTRPRLATDLSARTVSITTKFAIGRTEVTTQQFDAFVKATDYKFSKICNTVNHGNNNPWNAVDGSYQQPPAPMSAGPDYPVVCVTWHDAVAYVNWLAQTTGRRYRLPSEAEWEYAARAGTTKAYSFGDDQTDVCDYAWLADSNSPFGTETPHCVPMTNRKRDYGPSPVGLLKSNPWGLFDMHGNVWELVADCWSSSPTEGAVDQQAWQPAASCDRVQRGGSFTNGGLRTRSAARSRTREDNAAIHTGFRVAVSIDG